MKGGNLSANTLAPGYIVPLDPKVEADKRMAAMSKLYLQAFLTEQAIGLGQMFDGAPYVSMLGDSGLEELDSLLRQALTTSSLDAPVNGEEGRSFLGDLIADSSAEEPLDIVEQRIHLLATPLALALSIARLQRRGVLLDALGRGWGELSVFRHRCRYPSGGSLTS